MKTKALYRMSINLKSFLFGIKETCPEIIIQFSTGGRGRSAEERWVMLDLKLDMASLATGSINSTTSIYENPPRIRWPLQNRFRRKNHM